jgi:hypothetical protein
VLCLIIVRLFWAPTKVFGLPIAVRLYRNRQTLTKGKKSRGKASKPNPDHHTRPQLALELIQSVAQPYPDDEIILTGNSAYGGKSILSHLLANVLGELYRSPTHRSPPCGATKRDGLPAELDIDLPLSSRRRMFHSAHCRGYLHKIQSLTASIVLGVSSLAFRLLLGAESSSRRPNFRRPRRTNTSCKTYSINIYLYT